MMIIRMTGGLGNQMFQYALYLKLRSLGREVKFDDVSEYVLDNARPIMLWAFGIDYPKAKEEEVKELTDGFLYLSHRIRRKLFGRKSLEYHEKDCNFDEQVLKKESAYLTGYFQSEKYFKDIEKQVREAFVFKDSIYDRLSKEQKNKVLKYRQAVQATLSVSIHIRRGDYLANPKVFGGNCTDAYYESAISLMQENYPEAVFYVFSNEEEWADEWIKKRFSGKGSFIVIEGFPEEMGYLDMMLMSCCRHHIIANSSFSWWGAYLNASEKKCVIAPERWYNTMDCQDIYTDGMILIDAEGKRRY